MTTNLTKYRVDLDKLKKRGELLYYTMYYDLDLLDAKNRKEAEEIRFKDFKSAYEKWYTESLAVIRQIIPERQSDFIKLYKDEKRKITDYLTYTMSDYLIGLRVTSGYEVKVEPKAGVPKFEQQRNILESASTRFESTLLDIHQLLHADLLDSEIEEASLLLKNGYSRAAGAVAGVVLETHLEKVCQHHSISLKKKNLSISDYNDALKKGEVYDVPTWRFIQHLGDIRNLCDHKKTNDPKPEDIADLIQGVIKITKSVF